MVSHGGAVILPCRLLNLDYIGIDNVVSEEALAREAPCG